MVGRIATPKTATGVTTITAIEVRATITTGAIVDGVTTTEVATIITATSGELEFALISRTAAADTDVTVNFYMAPPHRVVVVVTFKAKSEVVVDQLIVYKIAIVLLSSSRIPNRTTWLM